LLELVMEGGRRTTAGRWSLEQAREHCARELAALPETLHALEQVPEDQAFPVAVSPELEKARQRVTRHLKQAAGETNS
jgi:hypothetical protein